MGRKRVFITVKTYPTISAKYDELVCTAGILEDGSWIRLYPLPFRKLKDDKQYHKYEWIEADVEKNTSDFRPETYKVLNIETIQVSPPPAKQMFRVWEERRRIIFNNKKIYTNLSELIGLSKKDNTSLAVFKPAKIHDLIWEETDREWPKEKIELLASKAKQLSLFESKEEVVENFQVVQKLPYKFSYTFCDDSGKKSTLMIEDWEIGMLYIRCLKNAEGNENIALKKVHETYFDKFLKKDLYFFLGTTLAYHSLSQNPFLIIGLFYPPKNPQLELFST